MSVSISGVDYSAGYPGAVALKQAGKVFTVRYLTYDWRGPTAAELADSLASQIEECFVYETTELRPLAGFSAGAYDAALAHSVLIAFGKPANQPIYFACDWDFGNDDLPAIREYFRGVMSVIGYERTGIYGGYTVMQDAAEQKYASWFWQTLAWQYGRGVYKMTTLYQWGFDAYINGVNCDLNTAFAANYGQASKFGNVIVPPIVVPSDVPPTPVDEPTKYARVKLPPRYAQINARKNPSQMIVDGNHWYPMRGRGEALDVTGRYSQPGPSAAAGLKVKKGEIVPFDWEFVDKKIGRKIYVNDQGFYRASSFTPDYPIPHPRAARP